MSRTRVRVGPPSARVRFADRLHGRTEVPSTPPRLRGALLQGAALSGGGRWKQAQPSEGMLSGRWWEMYNDPRLNALEEQVAINTRTSNRLRVPRRHPIGKLAPVFSSGTVGLPVPTVSIGDRRSGVQEVDPRSNRDHLIWTAHTLFAPRGRFWDAGSWGRSATRYAASVRKRRQRGRPGKRDLL